MGGILQDVPMRMICCESLQKMCTYEQQIWWGDMEREEEIGSNQRERERKRERERARERDVDQSFRQKENQQRLQANSNPL
jgi:hypothetical protein